jgi:hypothetical protein
MKIQSIRTKLYQWQGPVKTNDTIFEPFADPSPGKWVIDKRINKPQLNI